VGTTSFFPSKNLGCYGDGGAIFTNDDALAKKLRQVCNHGSEVRYYHDVVGVNSRLDSLQAAVLRIKLRQLDAYGAARNAAAAFYDQAFAGTGAHTCARSAARTAPTSSTSTPCGDRWHRDGLQAALGSERCSGHDLLPGALPLQNCAYKSDRCPKDHFRSRNV
jgi:dTDP-4-amino-4,6-dideoxygalactose transaminase